MAFRAVSSTSSRAQGVRIGGLRRQPVVAGAGMPPIRRYTFRPGSGRSGRCRPRPVGTGLRAAAGIASRSEAVRLRKITLAVAGTRTARGCASLGYRSGSATGQFPSARCGRPGEHEVHGGAVHPVATDPRPPPPRHSKAARMTRPAIMRPTTTGPRSRRKPRLPDAARPDQRLGVQLGRCHVGAADHDGDVLAGSGPVGAGAEGGDADRGGGLGGDPERLP